MIPFIKLFVLFLLICVFLSCIFLGSATTHRPKGGRVEVKVAL